MTFSFPLHSVVEQTFVSLLGGSARWQRQREIALLEQLPVSKLNIHNSNQTWGQESSYTYNLSFNTEKVEYHVSYRCPQNTFFRNKSLRNLSGLGCFLFDWVVSPQQNMRPSYNETTPPLLQLISPRLTEENQPAQHAVTDMTDKTKWHLSLLQLGWNSLFKLLFSHTNAL